ncbi:MAG: FAD-dependent oxidoreductase [Pseudomonadota bacterium]
MKIVIVGGGIGGLSAALTLARDDHRITVLERGGYDETTAAGIQLSPNATRLLERLGLGRALARVATEPRALRVREHLSGLTVAEVPLGAAARARFGAPYLHLLRADLIGVLRAAIADHPGVDLKLNCPVRAVSQADAAATAVTAGGEIGGDLLIGADGIRSRVRDSVVPGSEPQFSRMVGWRGLAPAAAVDAARGLDAATLWPGPGAHLVHYPAGRWINVIGVVERDDWTDPSWRARGTTAALLRDFRGWHAQVRQLLDAIETPYQWALHELTPLRHWHRGRIALLGDACHAMLPFAAQGAAQAIEDAWVLADALRKNGRCDAALAAYAATRRVRVERVQAESRRRAGVYHRRSMTRKLLDLAPGGTAAAVADGWSGDPYRWLYGYDAAVPTGTSA